MGRLRRRRLLSPRVRRRASRRELRRRSEPDTAGRRAARPRARPRGRSPRSSRRTSSSTSATASSPPSRSAASGRCRRGRRARGRSARRGARPDARRDDPHVWLDPVLFAASSSGSARRSDDPAAQPLVDELRALDREYRAGLADCARREIVTSHAAFGYLAAALRARAGRDHGHLSPRPSRRRSELADVVERRSRDRATTVFFETLVSPRLAETVAREVGARTGGARPASRG